MMRRCSATGSPVRWPTTIERLLEAAAAGTMPLSLRALRAELTIPDSTRETDHA
jgi:hypothetical protein